MKLLTQELQNSLPPLYANENKPATETMVVAKFFTPDSSWTWYVTEGSAVDEDGYYDTNKPKTDFIFFGLVEGHEVELGYFSLTELHQVRGSLGLPVERDLHWKPISLRDLQHYMNQGVIPQPHLCHDCLNPMEVKPQGYHKIVTCKDETCTLYGVTLSDDQYQKLTDEQFDGYRKMVAQFKERKSREQ